jgi:hypothetical protein
MILLSIVGLFNWPSRWLRPREKFIVNRLARLILEYSSRTKRAARPESLVKDVEPLVTNIRNRAVRESGQK